MPLKLFYQILLCFCASFLVYGAGQSTPAAADDVFSSHFIVTVDGRPVPVLHAAVNLYFLNFEARPDAVVTVTADQDDFWARGAEIQPWRLNIRPSRAGRTLTFHLKGAEKITLSRPGDFGANAEMLYLFANPREEAAATAATPGVRYFGAGIHHENIDAAAGDHIYLADGAIVFGSLNIWQVDGVTVSGRGVIVYDGPQNPADDDGWMHRKNWHCIVMDQAHDISIEGITCVVRSRTWQIQMKDSRRIVFDNIKVIGANDGNANADGLDWLGGGDTVVRDSFFRAADDVFALQTSWDGYGAEAFSHQGQPVTNISIKGGVFSTSISNIVRAAWPEKNFEGGNFTMRDADVIHMGLGGCGIPFALMELWADPNGRGRSAGFVFDNIRLEDWYSLLQLRQPAPGVSHVVLRDVYGLESPALIRSTLKGSIADVTLDRAGREVGTPPLEALDGAPSPAVVGERPLPAIVATEGWIRPGRRVQFRVKHAGQGGAGVRFHWSFGDGAEAFGRRVSHRFPDADGTLLDGSGRFRVLLETSMPAGRHAWAYYPVIVSKALQAAAVHRSMAPGLTLRYGRSATDPDARISVAQELSLASIPSGATNYSLTFEGFLEAPSDGGYTFFMVANEAATIELDGVAIAVSEPSIAQVCGLAGMAARAIQASAALKKGLHRLHIVESHGTGQDDFRVLWRGPGFALRGIEPIDLSH